MWALKFDVREVSESDIQDESELHSDSAQVTLEATERRPRAKAAQHKSGSGEGAGAAVRARSHAVSQPPIEGSYPSDGHDCGFLCRPAD